MWQYQRTEELYHHGVLGMRWGFRRYQNKDGSLTPLGKKKAAKLQSKYEKITGSKINNKNSDAVKSKEKKAIKDMTNEELNKTTTRLNLESNFIAAVNRRESFTPKEVSRGKEFIEKIGKDVIAPVLWDTAKQVTKSKVVDFVNKNLKLDDEYKIYTNNKKKN